LRFLLLIVLFAAACLASEATAHTRSQSLSRWSIEGDRIGVHVEAEALDVTRLYALAANAPLDDLFSQEVAQAFTVRAGARECAPNGEPSAAVTQAGRVTATWGFTCSPGELRAGPIEIESRLFLRVAPSHLHFAAVRDAQGRTAEAVLTEPHPRATLALTAMPAQRSAAETVLNFIPIGAEHVWTGLDHMAFILALVLFTAGRLSHLVVAATGFTIGHTATLGLAALGVLRPDTGVVEALIGFTIAFVALEIGKGGTERMRNASAPVAAMLAIAGGASLAGLAPMSPLIWFGLAAFVYAYPRGFPRGAALLALIFGLIHGCGFAGALDELDLPRPRLLAALLGFNLGVELGQLAVIASALAMGLAMRLAPQSIARHATPVAGAALFTLGLYWFVSRLVGSA